MPGKWADVLSNEAVRDSFKQLLWQRIEQEFEAEDELVNCVLDALVEAGDKQAVIEELTEVFEAATEPITDWCWETLAQLTVKQNEPSQPLTPATSGSPEQRAAEEQPAGDEQAPSQPKRAPIRFNLESSAPETAPKKASDGKAAQLGGRSAAAAPEPPSKPLAAAGPASAQQPPQAEEASARAGSGRQRAAPGASARMLHMTGLIRPGAEGSGSGRDSRARGRPLEPQREQQPADHSPIQQQRKRPLEDPRGGDSGRPGPGAAARRGPASVVVGAGSMFRSAVDSLKTDKSSGSSGGSRAQAGAAADAPPRQQQQQQAGTGSVFSRIAKDDLARLGVAQPQQQRAAPLQQQQQQPGQQRVMDGLPKSLQGRLGIMGARPSPAQAAQGPSMQAKPAVGAAAAAAAAPGPAVGAKRKASSEAAPGQSQAAPPAAAAAAKGASQEPQAGAAAAAKKSRTGAAAAAPAGAAPAGGQAALSSKEAQIAALRAQLEARQAEVQRLKQAQEADQVSVAVFGVSPRVPDTVLMAHFRSCADSCGANIRRCTLLAGRLPPHVTAPGAYLEFEGMGGDPASRAEAAQRATANALQLSGSMLLDQKITVLRKSEWQALQKQRAHPAAVRVPPAGGGNRSWKGPNVAGSGGAAPPAAAAGVDS